MNALERWLRLVLALCGVAIVAGTGMQDGDAKPAEQQQEPGRTEQDPEARARRQEERLSRAQIAQAFPRTPSLLSYLERNEPDAYRAVLQHSEKLTRQREAAALQLAREHHPELARLIQRLRRRQPAAYRAAIQQLVTDHAGILRAEQRGEADHRAALDEWRIRSQVRLVAARLRLADQPELQAQLKDLLAQGEQARRRQMRLEIERYQKQIERLQRRLEQDPDQAVEAQLRAFQNRRRK